MSMALHITNAYIVTYAYMNTVYTHTYLYIYTRIQALLIGLVSGKIHGPKPTGFRVTILCLCLRDVVLGHVQVAKVADLRVHQAILGEGGLSLMGKTDTKTRIENT